MHNLRRRLWGSSDAELPSKSSSDRTLSTEITSLAPTEAQLLGERLRALVQDGLAVDSIETPREPAREGKVVLRGRLRQPSYEVFPQWLAALKPLGYTPTLRPDLDAVGVPNRGVGEAVMLRVMPGVPPKYKPRVWINALLFVATILSTLSAGFLLTYGADIAAAANALGFIASNFWRGWPFAFSLLGILTAHEFGHYFAARYHKVAVTLPFFIPMPLTIIGTLGAFIQLKEPIADRRKLFDVGVAGPLAGLAVAIPLLFIGLATADLAIPVRVPDSGGFSVGNSLLYWLAKYATFGRPLPDPLTGETIALNQVTFAAWIGLLVTALNLLPIGQLDGGHTVFALFGQRARTVNIVTAVAMAFFGLAGLEAVQNVIPALSRVGYSGWFIWLGLIFFIIGPFHPPALDDVTTLNRGRRWVGYAMILIFVLTFVPVPFRVY